MSNKKSLSSFIMESMKDSLMNEGLSKKDLVVGDEYRVTYGDVDAFLILDSIEKESATFKFAGEEEKVEVPFNKISSSVKIEENINEAKLDYKKLAKDFVNNDWFDVEDEDPEDAIEYFNDQLDAFNREELGSNKEFDNNKELMSIEVKKLLSKSALKKLNEAAQDFGHSFSDENLLFKAFVKAVNKSSKFTKKVIDALKKQGALNEAFGEALKEEKGDKEEYQKFFNKTLKKYGVEEPDQLSKEDKKKFFDEIDAGWKGDNEKKEVNEGKKFKNTKDFEKFLVEIDKMSEYDIKKIMGSDYIDTPGFYQDEKDDYNGVLDFMKSNMGSKDLDKLEDWWLDNVNENLNEGRADTSAQLKNLSSSGNKIEGTKVTDNQAKKLLALYGLMDTGNKNKFDKTKVDTLLKAYSDFLTEEVNESYDLEDLADELLSELTLVDKYELADMDAKQVAKKYSEKEMLKMAKEFDINLENVKKK